MSTRVLYAALLVCSWSAMYAYEQGESVVTQRTSSYPVHDIILQRWSPRAMDPHATPLTTDECQTLFEAARYAPSSYNNQPWRFIYAHKGTPAWDALFNTLVPFNQGWCTNGLMLILVVSKNDFLFNGKPSRTHSFDTGAATQNLSLQAFSMGLVCHGMEGFDYDAARAAFGIPEGYTVEAMFVVGRPADPQAVLDQELAQRDLEKSDRRSIETIAAEGKLPA